MPNWLRNTIMIVVLSTWAIYMAVAIAIRDELPPLPLWTVPGATWALLSGWLPSWPRRNTEPAATPPAVTREGES